MTQPTTTPSRAATAPARSNPLASAFRRTRDRMLRIDRPTAESTAAAPTGNVLGDDLDVATLELITRVVARGEDVPGLSVYDKAQLHEVAFWRWVAYMGYDGKPPAAFPRHQHDWMLSNYRRTRWLRWPLRFASIVEIGCGPLGMVEYLPGREKVGFDPLNHQYDKLFSKVRTSGVRYVNDLDALVAARAGTFDLGICFNVLDHTTEPRALFEAYMRLIRPGGRFLFQLNIVRPGDERPEAHARMHPSPFTRPEISAWLDEFSHGYRAFARTEPSPDNEYFFMAWGRKNRRA